MSVPDPAMRPSRGRLAGQRRPTLLWTTSVWPSSRYQTTPCRGCPSSSTVAIEANRRGWRNSRTRGERAMGVCVVMGRMVRDVRVRPPSSVRRGGDARRGAARPRPAPPRLCPIEHPHHAARWLRLVGRATEQVPLPEVDAEPPQHDEIGSLLDPLRDEPGADPPAERHERLDERLLRVVARDSGDDLAVDLDDG